MTFAQKRVDLLQNLATFAQLDLSCKLPWFVNYHIKLMYTVRGKILDLTMPEFVKVINSKAYFKMVPSLVQQKADTPPISYRGNVSFFAFSGDLQTGMITGASPRALTSSLADVIHFPLDRLVIAPHMALLQ